MKGIMFMELIVIVSFLFIIGFFATLSLFLSTEIKTSIETTDVTIDTTYLAQTNDAIMIWDYMFPFILVMLFLMAIIGAYYIETHPFMFPIALIMLFVFFLIGGVFSNSYESVTQTGQLATYSAQMTITEFVMGHLLEIFAIFGTILLIAYFAKPSNAGGGQE